MISELFEGVSTKVRLVVLGMTIGAIALPMLLIMIFVRPEPFARSSVIGCYTAPGAPSLDVRGDAIHIIEPARRAMKYIVEPSKVSYQLQVSPALILKPQPSGHYAFVATQGIGFFWPLLPTEGQNRNRIRHPSEYAGRFEVATEGERIVYTRQTLSRACR